MREAKICIECKAVVENEATACQTCGNSNGNPKLSRTKAVLVALFVEPLIVAFVVLCASINPKFVNIITPPLALFLWVEFFMAIIKRETFFMRLIKKRYVAFREMPVEGVERKSAKKAQKTAEETQKDAEKVQREAAAREVLKSFSGAWADVSEMAKRFKVVHIEGIRFVDANQQISCVIDSELVFIGKKKDLLAKIPYTEIKNVSILEEVEQIRKNKSVIGRAIVGGLLLNPVAAVVGAISGATPTLKTTRKYYLEIALSENYGNSIVLTTDNSSLKKIKEAIIVKAR